MGEAIEAYRGITATEEFRNLEWMREKTRRDEAQALGNARRQRDKHWEGVVTKVTAEKDAAIDAITAEKNAVTAEKNAAIDAVTAENSLLRARLEELLKR